MSRIKYEYNGETIFDIMDQDDEDTPWIVVVLQILAGLFYISWTLGNLAMMIVGCLALDHIDIILLDNNAAAISMIVLGALFGGLPIAKGLL